MCAKAWSRGLKELMELTVIMLTIFWTIAKLWNGALGNERSLFKVAQRSVMFGPDSIFLSTNGMLFLVVTNCFVFN